MDSDQQELNEIRLEDIVLVGIYSLLEAYLAMGINKPFEEWFVSANDDEKMKLVDDTIKLMGG